MRRPWVVVAPAACLLLLAMTLYLRREQISGAHFLQPSREPTEKAGNVGDKTAAAPPATTSGESTCEGTRAKAVR